MKDFFLENSVYAQSGKLDTRPNINTVTILLSMLEIHASCSVGILSQLNVVSFVNNTSFAKYTFPNSWFRNNARIIVREKVIGSRKSSLASLEVKRFIIFIIQYPPNCSMISNSDSCCSKSDRSWVYQICSTLHPQHADVPVKGYQHLTFLHGIWWFHAIFDANLRTIKDQVPDDSFNVYTCHFCIGLAVHFVSTESRCRQTNVYNAHHISKLIHKKVLNFLHTVKCYTLCIWKKKQFIKTDRNCFPHQGTRIQNNFQICKAIPTKVLYQRYSVSYVQ